MAQTRKALFVGINTYPGHELFGCVNDVTEMRNLLVEKHGWASEDIRFLQDQKATRAAIVEGLRWLGDGAGEGDVRLFQFSGHGTRKHDETGDEQDGWDESLVPHDYFATDELLLDDTIRKETLAVLRRKAHLVMLMDSCHSGTVNKGFEEGSLFRFIKPRRGEVKLARAAKLAAKERLDVELEAELRAKLEEILARNLTVVEASQSISSVVKGALNRYKKKRYEIETISGTGVLLAGCGDNQQSEERSFDGKRHGALTYYVLDVLRSGPASYAELFDRVCTALDDNMFAQDPRLECSKVARNMSFLKLG